MRPGVVVVLNVPRNDLMQVPLAEDDEVIQAFSPDRANHSFGKGILPWRPWRNENLFDAHVLNSLLKECAIDAVTITN